MNASARRQETEGVWLSRLLAGLAVVDGTADRVVRGVSADSRSVRPGDLFLACAGTSRHGAAFIEEALAKGAEAVVVEAPLEESNMPGAAAGASPAGPPLIAVHPPAGPGTLAGEIAARFHARPAESLEVLGVTGTNGKTSCCHYLAQCLSVEESPCGILGTLGHGLPGALEPATHTTPDAVSVQRLLAALRDSGCRRVAMEVSSHALDQGRVHGVTFRGALFTNLSREHLDYHRTMTRYAACKARLFQVQGLQVAAFNAADEWGRRLLADVPAGVVTAAYGLDAVPRELGRHRLRGEVLACDANGLRLRVTGSWGSGEFTSGLLGRWQAANLLGVLALLLLLEMPLAEALSRLSAVRPVPGRMEAFGGGDRPLVVVDYAHTPAALEAALAALRELVPGRLWCVFGCGGERDPGKRAPMGAIAERLADEVVVTSDNPRHEEPEAIVADILRDMRRPQAVRIMPDRAAAIREAVAAAAAGDGVLVAGKGHEDYQLVGGQRLPFSDRRLVAELLGERV